jgi:hypothetical protein
MIGLIPVIIKLLDSVLVLMVFTIMLQVDAYYAITLATLVTMVLHA